MSPSDRPLPQGLDLPELHDAVVVAAFEWWNDAGDAASDALEHLDAMWEARNLVEIDDESYYDYQVNRPVIRQVDGVTRELVWPSMRITALVPIRSPRVAVLPSTLTRPSLISASISRREPIPARANTFCNFSSLMLFISRE